jgi:hypothetical protein
LDEGPENKRTAKYTLDTSGGPRLDRAADPRLQRPDSRDWAFLESLLPALDLPGGAVVHDVAARRGAGISSLPALRYWVLIGPAGGPATDILDLREVIDPPAYPRALVPGPGWEGHPGRLAAAEGHLWSRPDADPHAQALGAGGLVFKVLTRSSWQQDLDRADVEEALASQDLDLDGARGLATDLGRVLGAGHRRSILADGRPAAPAIQADLDSGGGLEVLRAELRAVVAEDTATIAADTRILSSLLHEYGPLLGAESLPTEAP